VILLKIINLSCKVRCNTFTGIMLKQLSIHLHYTLEDHFLWYLLFTSFRDKYFSAEQFIFSLRV